VFDDLASPSVSNSWAAMNRKAEAGVVLQVLPAVAGCRWMQTRFEVDQVSPRMPVGRGWVTAPKQCPRCRGERRSAAPQPGSVLGTARRRAELADPRRW
jgi:hypothetical protein